MKRALSEAEVRDAVRRVVRNGELQRGVAADLGVHKNTIGQILRSETYSELHLPLRREWPRVRERRWRENGREFDG